jgi:YegS/Rv2252/BmrU family lipid kinase
MIYLIYNPVAGRGRARRARGSVLDLLTAAGLPTEVLTTEGPGHATHLTQNLPEDAKVICLGGDGTIHEVASACTGTERTLGALPVGSGDDFAFALGLGHHDLSRAVQVIKRGKVRSIDTGLVNGEVFVNAIGVGFDAEVTANAQHAPGFLKGHLAYLYAVLATLHALELTTVEASVDGTTVYQGPSLLTSIHNGPRIGGGFLFAPNAELDDDRLEVLIATDFDRLGTLAILPRVLRGTHLNHPKVRLFRGREIALRWSAAKQVHVDGELLEPQAEFSIRLRPASLKVFSP